MPCNFNFLKAKHLDNPPNQMRRGIAIDMWTTPRGSGAPLLKCDSQALSTGVARAFFNLVDKVTKIQAACKQE